MRECGVSGDVHVGGSQHITLCWEDKAFLWRGEDIFFLAASLSVYFYHLYGIKQSGMKGRAICTKHTFDWCVLPARVGSNPECSPTCHRSFSLFGYSQIRGKEGSAHRVHMGILQSDTTIIGECFRRLTDALSSASVALIINMFGNIGLGTFRLGIP